jgi:hypothetical protein
MDGKIPPAEIELVAVLRELNGAEIDGVPPNIDAQAQGGTNGAL